MRVVAGGQGGGGGNEAEGRTRQAREPLMPGEQVT